MSTRRIRTLWRIHLCSWQKCTNGDELVSCCLLRRQRQNCTSGGCGGTRLWIPAKTQSWVHSKCLNKRWASSCLFLPTEADRSFGWQQNASKSDREWSSTPRHAQITCSVVRVLGQYKIWSKPTWPYQDPINSFRCRAIQYSTWTFTTLERDWKWRNRSESGSGASPDVCPLPSAGRWSAGRAAGWVRVCVCVPVCECACTKVVLRACPGPLNDNGRERQRERETDRDRQRHGGGREKTKSDRQTNRQIQKRLLDTQKGRKEKEAGNVLQRLYAWQS